MPTTNHTITVSINGVDRTSVLAKDSLFIRSGLNNSIDIAEFTMIKIDGATGLTAFIPVEWDSVMIYIDGAVVFGGFIMSISATGDSSHATFRVECKDWTVLFDSVIVNKAFTDTSDSAIIDAVFSEYLGSEGFDVSTNVSIVYDDVDIAFDYISVREVLNLLSNVVGSIWHVSPDKKLYWSASTSPARSSFDINTVSPNGTTTHDVLRNSLSFTVDASGITNRVTVIGGEIQSSELQTDTFTASSSQYKYGPLSKEASSMWLITWTDNQDINWSAYTSDIGAYPITVIDPETGDVIYDTPTEIIEKLVTVNLDSKYVEFNIAPYTLKDGSTITVQYYYKTSLNITRDNEPSQATYNKIFNRTVYDSSLSDLVTAARYADAILAENAYGKETATFTVSEHGLLPGRLITIHAPTLGVQDRFTEAANLLEDKYGILLEDGSKLLLEKYDTERTFLIREISLQSVAVSNGGYMVLANVTAGAYSPTIIESIKEIANIQMGIGRRVGSRSNGSLSDISVSLGEVRSGRAIFTDGGDGRFSWTDYNGHTGAVVGLEDQGNPAPYGAVMILQDGTVRFKAGKLDSLPSVNGISPTGWGIYTDNGYFSGVITASQMIGGTIATTSMPINSSNPGVYMTQAGIFAYGTLGLTFSIPSDPALAPYFSSGTINNVVYEVYDAGVIRTSANPSSNGGVQIDDSGIFAYATPANGGGLKFSVDANTGRMTAVDGTFSGTVSVASGTVVMNASGQSLIMTSGTAFNTPTSVKWTRSGIVASNISGRYDGSYDYLWAEAGVDGSKSGEYRLHTYGTSSNQNFSYRQNDAACNWTEVTGGTVRVVQALTHSEIQIYKSIVPYFTYNTVNLGSATTGFRYLYLRDSNNVNWRVEVNTSGALVVTAA